MGLTEDPRRGGAVQGRGWREPLKATSLEATTELQKTRQGAVVQERVHN